jgi:hypothetical protein
MVFGHSSVDRLELVRLEYRSTLVDQNEQFMDIGRKEPFEVGTDAMPLASVWLHLVRESGASQPPHHVDDIFKVIAC